MSSVLRCEGLVKTYGKKEVLNKVNLELEQGKIYGLIGRNGAGKTTLLSIMSAQKTASAGSVILDGEPVWENQPVLDRICFSREIATTTFGNNANNMRVREYIRAAAIYFPNWDQEMADRLIEKFQLDTKKKISKMSKGMLSMVTIIVAMASKAEFTFLDEPVSGLDVIMREYFYRVLLDEYTESGRTFVISTHIIEEASDVFEEVIMIDKGTILLKENTQDLVARAYKVSGLAEVVDEAVSGYERHHEEKLGRSKGVTILLKDGQDLPKGYDVTIQPLNLQNVFVALCGMEE